MPINSFLSSHGINYIVRRNNSPDRKEKGLLNRDTQTKRAYISFAPGTDIKADDILINPAGEMVYVVEVETAYFTKKPYDLRAYFQTAHEKQLSNTNSAPVFNIQNAYGSIIGTGNNATLNYNSAINDLKERINSETAEDKSDMEKIVSLLEMVVNNQVPPSKGLFSKFSAVMNRHSWLANSVAGAILSWLMSKI